MLGFISCSVPHLIMALHGCSEAKTNLKSHAGAKRAYYNENELLLQVAMGISNPVKNFFYLAMAIHTHYNIFVLYVIGASTMNSVSLQLPVTYSEPLPTPSNIIPSAPRLSIVTSESNLDSHEGTQSASIRLWPLKEIGQQALHIDRARVTQPPQDFQ